MDRQSTKWFVAGGVAIVALVCGTVLWLQGPESAQVAITHGVMWVAGVVGPLLVAWLGRDANHNGKPDWLEREGTRQQLDGVSIDLYAPHAVLTERERGELIADATRAVRPLVDAPAPPDGEGEED